MKSRMRGYCFAVLFAAAGLTNSSAADAPPPPSDESLLKPVGEGWLPVFNGMNLDGWKVEPGFWNVNEGGILHGHTPGEAKHHYGYTEKTYDNFELHADVKLVGNNSGVCIRINPEDFDNVPGYQVDMGDGYWGCLWEEKGRGMVARYSREDADKLVHKNDWNHYYVRAQGHHIQMWLNGVKTVDVVDEKGPLTGSIGFQLCHGTGRVTDASFKNVLYRPLKSDAAK